MARTDYTLRKDGRLYTRVYLGKDDQGKKKYKNIYNHSPDEMDEKILQVKLSLRKGINIQAESDTFKQRADRSLMIKKSEVSTGRYVTYE